MLHLDSLKELINNIHAPAYLKEVNVTNSREYSQFGKDHDEIESIQVKITLKSGRVRNVYDLEEIK